MAGAVVRRPKLMKREPRARRVSHSLTAGQRQSIGSAAIFAIRLGLPLNRFITVNWSTAGVRNGFESTQAFIKRCGDWLRARGVRLAYVRVREGVGGDHVHILLHVPEHLIPTFWPAQNRWLRAVGAGFSKGSVLTRPVGRGYGDYRRCPRSYLSNLRHVVRYLWKLNQPSTGLIEGQRISVAASLNTLERMKLRRSRRPRASIRQYGLR